jgi:predicted SprT family Zn-dependent metalloprotease
MKMNRVYGYNISTSGDVVAMGITVPLQRNYVLVCQKCNNEIIRERMCKVVKHPEKFHCNCGGRLVLQ